jgi:hypothetical protein
MLFKLVRHIFYVLHFNFAMQIVHDMIVQVSYNKKLFHVHNFTKYLEEQYYMGLFVKWICMFGMGAKFVRVTFKMT